MVEKKGKTEQIVTGVTKGSVSAVMPYVAVGVVGYVAVKALKEKIGNNGGPLDWSKLPNGAGAIDFLKNPLEVGANSVETYLRKAGDDAYQYAVEKNPLSPENLDNHYDKSATKVVGVASWTWGTYTDLLKSDPLYGTKMGMSLVPGGAAAVGISKRVVGAVSGFLGSGQSEGKTSVTTKTSTPASGIKPDVVPYGVLQTSTGAGPTTKYVEKSSNSTAKSYVDSTGREYTPTNVIKAKW